MTETSASPLAVSGLLGRARSAADPTDGLRWLRRAALLAPDHAGAWAALSAAEAACGRDDDACRAGLAAHALGQVEAAVARIVVPRLNKLAGEALASYRHADADRLLGRAVRLAPRATMLRFNRAALRHGAGALDRAVDDYRRVLADIPASPHGLARLAQLRLDQGDRAGAAAGFARTIAADPTDPDGWAGRARAAGPTGAAAAALRRAVLLAPGGAAHRVELARTMMLRGDHAGGLRQCAAARAADRWNVRALALEASGLAALGRAEEARRIADPDRLVRARRIAAPPGFSSTAAFNEALAAHVLSHVSLTRDPARNATRGGWHTGELLRDDAPAIRALEHLIRQAILAHEGSLPIDPEHPLTASRPPSWALTAWAVVMERQGHQVPHIHSSGWLSGVYYVALPPDILAPGSAAAGWIEFGRGPASDDKPQLVRLVTPEEGLMVTFPSYLWHRTIPYDSAARRISVAFDAMPVRGPRSP